MKLFLLLLNPGITKSKMAGLKVVEILALFALLFFSGSHGFSYEGYKVYEITPQTEQDADFLQHLGEVKFDFWKESRGLGNPSDIMVAPEDQWNFERELKAKGIQYNIVVENVERLIQEERIERSLSRSSLRAGSITFTSFMFFGEHMAYLRRLADDYPNIVTLEEIGQSYEGRDIVLLKLSSGPNLTSPKPAIFIDAGIHSREWIAPPVALYAIHQLVENITNSVLYEEVDWYIIPNLNPDGYEYTQSDNRLWRKNRRLTEGAACYGTDLNRNFGYHWMVGGASNNSCAETYAGPEAFSEPEARALRDWFLQNSENVKLYLSIHSFGELLLYPWSYEQSVPDDVDELQALGEKVVAAIEGATTIGSSYVVNGSAMGLYVAAGVTTDWVKAEAGVQLSYIIELPNGDAPFWFMIPARQILPVVQETWEGIKVYHEYVVEKYITNATQTEPNWNFILRNKVN